MAGAMILNALQFGVRATDSTAFMLRGTCRRVTQKMQREQGRSAPDMFAVVPSLICCVAALFSSFNALYHRCS